MEKKYKMTLNGNQLSMIAVALEQYSRMMCGQLGTNYLPSIDHAIDKEYPLIKDYISIRNKVNDHLSDIKKLIWKITNHGNKGIGYDENSDMAYDMYKIIRHQYELEKQEETKKLNSTYHTNVHSEYPLKHSTQPLMKVELIDPREIKIERILNNKNNGE